MEATNKNYVFLVDDDEMYLAALKHQLSSSDNNKEKNKNGIEFKTFLSGEHCLKNLDMHPSIVILDYYLKKAKNALSGIQTLNEIKKYNSDTQVIMLSSHEDIDLAVNCIKHDAFDYVIKNESAFIRAKHLISNILYNLDIKKEMKKFERWNIAAAIALILIIVLCIMIL